MIRKDLATDQSLDDYALLAWCKFKAASGLPEQSFTDRERELFIAGIAWFVADEVE